LLLFLSRDRMPYGPTITTLEALPKVVHQKTSSFASLAAKPARYAREKTSSFALLAAKPVRFSESKNQTSSFAPLAAMP